MSACPHDRHALHSLEGIAVVTSMSVYLDDSWIVAGDGIELGRHRGTFLMTLLMLDSCHQGWGLWRDPKCAQRKSCVQYWMHQALYNSIPSFDDLFEPFWCVHVFFVRQSLGLFSSTVSLSCNLTRNNMPMRSVVTRLRKRPESQASDSILWRPGAAVRCPMWQGVRLLDHSETWQNWDLTKPTQLKHVPFDSRTFVFSGNLIKVVHFFCV